MLRPHSNRWCLKNTINSCCRGIIEVMWFYLMFPKFTAGILYFYPTITRVNEVVRTGSKDLGT